MAAKATTQALVGQRFGMLTAVALVPHKGRTEMLCRCDCGTEKVICIRRLVPHSRSCGCVNSADIIPEGTVYGTWTVGAYGKDPDTGRCGFWCRCACGTEALVEGRALRAGRSTGCVQCCGPKRAKADTPSNDVWHSYRLSARQRGIPFDLSQEQFRALAVQRCAYCGSDPASVALPNTSYGVPWHHNGVDRKDSTQGYTEGNCAPCCGTCNYMKGTQALADFFGWVARVSSATPNPQRHAITERQAASVAAGYRSRAKRHGRTYTLTLPEAQALFESACSYCGAAPANSQASSYYQRKDGTPRARFVFTGIDRVDPAKGYTPGNCRSACWTCNNAKGSHTVGAFLAHVQRIHHHQMGLISSR